MATDPVVERVESLERIVESLANVGGRVDQPEVRVAGVELQIVHLRSEMKDEFSAVLEIVESSSHATQRLHDEGRVEMRQLLEESVESLQRAMTESDEATRAQMRSFHEDVIA